MSGGNARNRRDGESCGVPCGARRNRRLPERSRRRNRGWQPKI